MDHPTKSGNGESPLSTTSSKGTIDVSEIRTVKVSNVAPAVAEKDIYEFFTFSGEIQYIEMQSETENTKVAFVTYKDSQGADTAALLTGATIAGNAVVVATCEDYNLPPNAVLLTSGPTGTERDSAVNKAEDVVSTMLARGFVLGKDALNRAKSFDEKHQLTLNASATVASLDRRMGLSQKLSMGTAAMNEKVKEMDERFQVSEKTKSAIAAAEQKASSAGSAIMSNRYVFTSAVWVTNALTAVSKAAEEVSAKTKEKVGKAEEGKEGCGDEKAEEGKESCGEEKAAAATTTGEDKNDKDKESPTIPVISADETNKAV